MVSNLVGTLLGFPEIARIVVTLNIPELMALPAHSRVQVVENAFPKGFAANHNAAFRQCAEPYFCPLNPDIEFDQNPFPVLLEALCRSGAAVIAPLVKSPQGEIEDSIRRFPTPSSLLRKALGRNDGRYVVQEGQPAFFPEWVGGMFMLFKSRDFGALKGFDEAYYLYYEDVDICLRAWRQGMSVLAFPQVSVIHDARRASRAGLRHLRWHLTSLGRFLWKYWGRLPKVTDDFR